MFSRLFQEGAQSLRPTSDEVHRDRKWLEEDWRRWVPAMFPEQVSDDDGELIPFAPHHEDFWDHLWAIKRGIRVSPTLWGWPRGQAKSTNMEMGCAALGARSRRSYALYVSGLQDQADDHVGNIGDMLVDSVQMATHYPEMARRGTNTYGHSEGWRRNRIVTASNFVVDAIGLDTARARGKKLRIGRPDLIILDDLDDQGDSPEVVEKKIQALVNRVLPAGAEDLIVIGGQNIVHPFSIFARLFGVSDIEEDVDFLVDRILSGPIPAIENFEYTRLPPGDPDGFPDRSRYIIIGGTPTWIGMGRERCQEIIDTEGLTAFLRERQHEVEAPPGGMYDHIEFDRVAWRDVPWLMMERIVVWVDPSVTFHDGSDAHGIQADGIASNGLIYRLFSFEQKTSPEDAIKRAIRKAVELGANKVGIETDQGGDTWRSVFREAGRSLVEAGEITPQQLSRVGFDSEKAGQGHGSKVHRNGHMLADYERGRIIHVEGTHHVLERSLRRFPKTKPLDLADTAYWSWLDLDKGSRTKTTSRTDSAFGQIASGWGSF